VDETTTTTTRYYQLTDGRIRQVTLSEGMSLPTPDGAVLISPEEYATALGVIEETRAAAEAEQQEAEEAEAKVAYLALAAILPDAVAQRLSGYTPPPGPILDPGGVIDLD
jgi:hypothetical protein